MNENILVSIIMPAYNAERTIDEAIQSVCQQTYGIWELIIVNDCSSDGTECIVTQYMQKDNRIHLINNKQNAGVSEARNIGITSSNGKWIAFLDSDDKWKNEKLEKQVKLLTEKPLTDLVFTGSAFINQQGVFSKYILNVPEKIKYRQLLKQNIISCSSVVVRKKLAQNYRMQYDDMHEDYAVWLQILKAGYFAAGINEPLLIYRISDHSKSSNKKIAAKMTFKVYRFMNLNYIKSVYFFLHYAVKSINKYKKIEKGF